MQHGLEVYLLPHQLAKHYSPNITRKVPVTGILQVLNLIVDQDIGWTDWQVIDSDFIQVF